MLRDRATLDALTEDIALLTSVGIRVVLVHGGGAQVTETAARLGIETKFVGGRRVTDEETLAVLTMVIAGKMSIEIVSSLKKYGIKAAGFSGVSAGIIEATRRPPTKVSGSGDEVVDFGQVGDIREVDPAMLNLALDNNIVPVLAPLGADDEGNVFNINADVVAARVAIALQAEKLVLLTGAPGVMEDINDPTTLISVLSLSQAREAIERGIIKGGMIPKVEEAHHALTNGVRRVHILSGLDPHQLLLEIFTESGCGTMLVV
ncbi:MAG: acetylglutamate kinase [Planctomycetes bacterium]|nr:acetylglutamate kinase [Planctomycetota bacterium]